MKHRIHNILALTLSGGLLLVASCGRKQTVASKSAEAFREAQKKGIAVGGETHGGHAAGEEPATMTGMDHSTMTAMDHATMTGMDHSTMTGMDHSQMQHGQEPMAGMDHSQKQHAQQPMKGMDHSQMQHGQQPMAGMDHGSMPGMQHGAAAAARPVTPPTSNAEMQAVRPSSTLKGDSFDAPAPAAVSEAAKASQGGGHEGMEMPGITPGEDRENPPTPAPAIRDNPAAGTSGAPPMDHSRHGQTAPAAQSRTTSPQAQPAAATVYTCPMHPEVTSDKPGTCPKCGMTLVKKQ